MKIKDRPKLLAMAAIAVVAVFFGDRLLLSPLTKAWKERAARIADLRQKVSQGAVLLEREQSIRDRWAQVRTNALPSDMSLAEQRVLKSFERWSQSSRISITSIKPQWKRGADDFQTLECRVDAYGSVEALSRFLFDIEKDPLALKIEAVEISARDNNGQQLALALQVSGLLLNPPAL